MQLGGEPETAEHRRLAEATGRVEDDLFNAHPWCEWGPYLAERAWGTVREDYSDTGDPWSSFPHVHARSRSYRWDEDGMAGHSDIRHELRLGLSLWNGDMGIGLGASHRIGWTALVVDLIIDPPGVRPGERS